MLTPPSHNYNNNMAASSLRQTSLQECSGSSEIAFNSNIGTSLLPWEQSLDLKTGEVYYINWTSGMKAKEDPSSSSSSSYSEDDESSYEESGGLSSSESSSAVSSSRSEQVLVVAGCKRCLMYFMVAKHVEECPKCNAQLLHFHQTDPIPS